jgi:formate dehydrogenase subunit delta
MSTDAPGGGAQDAAGHGGGPEQLVKMANDIGHFFRAESEREDAIAGIVNHIDKFWTKRMREKLRVLVDYGGHAGLDELPREAVRRLFVPPAPSSSAASSSAASSSAAS